MYLLRPSQKVFKKWIDLKYSEKLISKSVVPLRISFIKIFKR